MDPVQYEYHEVDPSELPSSELLQEMQNMAPPQPILPAQSEHIADNNMETTAPKRKKTSRHKQNTSEDIDKVQVASVKERTRKQTVWGVNVFRGKYFSSISHKSTKIIGMFYFLKMRII